MARRFVRFTFAAFAVLAIPSLPAAAQSVEEFYKGRTVTLTISFGPGGLNDIAGRPGCAGTGDLHGRTALHRASDPD
jgi:hypothetical protein